MKEKKRVQINMRIDTKTKVALATLAYLKKLNYSEMIRYLIITEAQNKGIWK